MFAHYSPLDDDDQDWLLPDISADYPKPKFDRQTNQGMWQVGDKVHLLSEPEVYTLSCFVGKYTQSHVQRACSRKFPDCPEDLVAKLVEKLVGMGVLAVDSGDEGIDDAEDQENSLSPGISPAVSRSPLKPGLQWIPYRHWWLKENLWLLRNPIDRAFMFMNEDAKEAIELLETISPAELTKIEPQFPLLWQHLKMNSMIQGTSPSKGKRRGKFNPLQLLFFEKPLANPDRWLSRHVDKLGWLWSRTSGYLMVSGLIFSAILATSQAGKLAIYGQDLWKNQGSQLLLPFIIYSLIIVAIHELGHCFTLKHYARQVPQLDLKVPEVGVMFMCLMPTAYCLTTDSYFLPKVYQRALVVGAGLVVQFLIWMGAFWLLQIASPTSWLYSTSYLVMTAALVTVLWNMNPLAKFDGYFFLEAITGVIDLRGRSRDFYRNLLTFKPSNEPQETRWILLAYAPFSLAYSLLVFGFLLSRLLGWSLENIPMLLLTLFLGWLIYFYFPEPKNRSI
jgi:putative peptide zinc metalloprotease protein